MFQELVGQFLQSGAAKEAVASVTQQTELDAGQAEAAVKATAEGAAEAATEQGGLANMAGSLLGGGGLGGLAGSLMGGGGGDAGLPASLVQSVSGIVAEKTGISPQIAAMVVNVALPKVLAFFKGDKGGDGGGDAAGGGGGLLGGLLG